MVNLNRKYEWLRLLLLFSLIIYAYYPFLSGLNIGAMDARWYQYLLHDVVIQFKHHIFPPVVGQSEFNYIGISYVRAPYYLLLGTFVYAITAGFLNVLMIQHLTIILSALVAGLLSYSLFNKLASNLRWYALLLAFFYISCPGVMSLIYKMDMYNSFMAIPFIPLVIYGLVRTNQKNDLLSYLIISMGLSLVWLSHPPIAIWISLTCLLFFCIQFCLSRKICLKLFIIPCVFLLLNLWQFAGIFSLGMQDYYDANNFLNQLMKNLKQEMPGTFLPLGFQNSGTPFLQLGYTLWLMVFAGFFAFIRIRYDSLIRNLFINISLLIILLFPIPGITYWVWSMFPQSFCNLSPLPMQRLYVILAGLSCFLGILCLKRIYPVSKNSSKLIIGFVFLMGFFWNIYQINYYHTGLAKSENNTWDSSKNIMLMPYGMLPSHSSIAEFTTYDPVLKNRLLDKQQLPILNYDNQTYLLNKCTKHLLTLPNGIQIEGVVPKMPLWIRSETLQPFLSFKGLSTNNLFLCIESHANNTGISAQIVDFARSLVATNKCSTEKELELTKQVFTMPFFINDATSLEHFTKNWSLLLGAVSAGEKKKAAMKVKSFGIIEYNPDELPIHITSLTPYKAVVDTGMPNSYLSVFKEYFPGYEAKVNGKPVPVLQTKDKMVIIPLKDKGHNEIELSYHQPMLLKFTFGISTIAWCMLTIYLISLAVRKRVISERKTWQ